MKKLLPACRNTRLDVDFATDEVLIEEIQSDLIRDLEAVYRVAKERTADSHGQFYLYGFKFDKAKALQYCEQLLVTQRKLWSEAMLTAALYTDLPEQFCFQQTEEAPAFIATDKKATRRLKAIKKPRWYLMAS